MLATDASANRSISIGGGPSRAHPTLKNLNIALMDNVDVVADACALPFPDDSLWAIHCEAVLEHLELPNLAVEEMHRVLRTGGQVFAATPFLQGFHGFPSHFQNFTLVGHRRLFERAGFEVIGSGVCVGPTVALSELHAQYLRELLPGTLVRRLIARLVWLLELPIRALDRFARNSPRAHAISSSTFVQAIKRL